MLLHSRTRTRYLRLRSLPVLFFVFNLQAPRICYGADAETEGRRHQAHDEARLVSAACAAQQLQAHAAVPVGAFVARCWCSRAFQRRRTGFAGRFSNADAAAATADSADTAAAKTRT